ncbi:MAG: hypothetical protein HY810_04185 [Candidatus Omnitrophica bacterium]|nr:hypothetical protein [Candidatus Omnitrophota bacterium]
METFSNNRDKYSNMSPQVALSQMSIQNAFSGFRVDFTHAAVSMREGIPSIKKLRAEFPLQDSAKGQGVPVNELSLNSEGTNQTAPVELSIPQTWMGKIKSVLKMPLEVIISTGYQMIGRPAPSKMSAEHVIAVAILVSVHAIFMTAPLALPPELRWKMMEFIYFSWETIISLVATFFAAHTHISIHEMGHYLTAGKINALPKNLQAEFTKKNQGSLGKKILWYLSMFLKIPYGKFEGIKKEGLGYYLNAPFNLRASAAGPTWSRNLALVGLAGAVLVLAPGLILNILPAIYVGRVFFSLMASGYLTFKYADPGSYRKFKEQEELAAQQAEEALKRMEVQTGEEQLWHLKVAEITRKVRENAMKVFYHPIYGRVIRPDEWRNSSMGGEHLSNEFKESNISAQEGMFLIIGAENGNQAQEWTVKLQNRLRQIIANAENSSVLGVGLEGGLATNIARGDYPIPEIKSWLMMTQAILDCNLIPGKDVAIAFDVAASELSNNFRIEKEQEDAVGMYLFWKDAAKVVMNNKELLQVYKDVYYGKYQLDYKGKKVTIPLLSLEDGFAEDDFDGWKMAKKEFGKGIFIVADDLATTNDAIVEKLARAGLADTLLVKANQIGTLSETMLAVSVAMAHYWKLISSHRSKSPVNPFEAHVAIAYRAMGVKVGGGQNTERVLKYHELNLIELKAEEFFREFMKIVIETVQTEGFEALENIELILDEKRSTVSAETIDLSKAKITNMLAVEEPTNAGIPTVGVTINAGFKNYPDLLTGEGATPLGTSAGSNEAIHLVDSMIEYSEYGKLIDQYPDLFKEHKLFKRVYNFAKDVDPDKINKQNNSELKTLWERAGRYAGKGTLNASDNAQTLIAEHLIGKSLADFDLLDVDRFLLDLEKETAKKRGKLDAGASAEELIKVMQRKQNLGMNAILSTSIAMGEIIAKFQNKELWQILEEEFDYMVAMAMLESGVIDVDKEFPELAGKDDAAKVKWLVENLFFEDLLGYLQKINDNFVEQNRPLYELLRKVTRIYSYEEHSKDIHKEMLNNIATSVKLKKSAQKIAIEYLIDRSI